MNTDQRLHRTIHIMIRALAIGLFVVAGTLAGPAAAAVWDETTDGGGDAGTLIATAQLPAGVGQLTQITGMIPGPEDVDLYALYIPNPAAFSAVSTDGFTYSTPRLFLFDATGLGVAGYIDSTNTGAALSSSLVTAPGVYYLALSGWSYPENAPSQNLWTNPGVYDIERAPDGIAAAATLNDWTPSIVPVSFDDYTIDLTGATFVPEPMTLSLLAIGGIAMIRKRR